jgi:hypothetical protein
MLNFRFSSNNSEIWIENAHLGSHWILHENTFLRDSGKRLGDKLPSGILHRYHTRWTTVSPFVLMASKNKFTGAADSATTLWMGKSALSWFADRGVEIAQVLLENIDDIPVRKTISTFVDTTDEIIEVLQWMIGNKRDGKGKENLAESRRLSADEITSRADIEKILASRASC